MAKYYNPDVVVTIEKNKIVVLGWNGSLEIVVDKIVEVKVNGVWGVKDA